MLDVRKQNKGKIKTQTSHKEFKPNQQKHSPEEIENIDENFLPKSTNERKSNEKVSSVVKVDKIPSNNKMILYLVDKDSNRKAGASRNTKKLMVSSSGNIPSEKGKRIYKKIDLRTAGMKLKQSGISNRKSVKPQSNSRGNAYKYKQSSNKKRNKLDREFRSQTRQGTSNIKAYPSHAKIELFKTEKHLEDDKQESKCVIF